MLGFVRSCGEKNCSSVGGLKAGAWTSEHHSTVSLLGLLKDSCICSGGGCILRKSLGGEHTFADALRGVHLCTILHGMQGKVNLRERLLLSHGTHGIVDVLRLVDIFACVLHVGRCAAGRELCAQEQCGGEGNEQ